MATRSARIQEKGMISNGGLVNKNVFDYSRKGNQLTSFDEECRKIIRNEDKYFEKQKSQESAVKGLRLTETDYQLMDNLVKTQKLARMKSRNACESDSQLIDNLGKTQKLARMKSRKACESCLCHLDNAAALISQQPSTSASNKLIQNHQKELIGLSKKGTSSESKPFSNALQVLSINKDLFNPQKIIILKPASQNRKSTSFCLRDFRKKLKHTFGGTKKEHSYNSSIFGDDCICRGVDITNPSYSPTIVRTNENLGDKQDNLNFPTRKKIDFPSNGLSNKHEVDVVLEAKIHLSERVLKNLNATGSSSTSKRSLRTLKGILSTPEDDFRPVSPRRDNIYFSTSFSPSNGQQTTSSSPSRTNREVTSCNDYEESYDTVESFSTETRSSLIQNTDEEAQDTIISRAHEIVNSNGETTIENGTFTRMYHLDMPENIMYHEEHQSPVSVLEQIFIEDANSPSRIMLETAKQRLKPRRLHFEECSLESPIDEQDYISKYIHLVLKASRLSWDKLSKISPQSQELLNPSLFDEVKFPPCDSNFHPKLIFDHINEVLLKIHRSHLGLPFIKPRSCLVPLEELMVDEIMRETAYFYLLPRTEKPTLDQLVARDLADYRLWLIDARMGTELIVIDISEGIMEELVLDIILGFGE